MNTSFLVGETSMSFLKGVRLYKVGGKIGRKGWLLLGSLRDTLIVSLPLQCMTRKASGWLSCRLTTYRSSS